MPYPTWDNLDPNATWDMPGTVGSGGGPGPLPANSKVGDHLQWYIDTLIFNGVRAAMDIRDINPPAVQFRAPVMHYRFGRGCVGVDWEARLILPNLGNKHAINMAQVYLERIQDALSGAVVAATPADFDMPDGGGPAPGYVLTWQTR
jgi:hypothetical protein